jgi:two-component system, LytTR family, response regulator
MIKTTGRVIFIRAEEIDWIEAYDNYVRLRVGGKAHLLRQTMNELEAALNPEQFARIHRSTIVSGLTTGRKLCSPRTATVIRRFM